MTKKAHLIVVKKRYQVLDHIFYVCKDNWFYNLFGVTVFNEMFWAWSESNAIKFVDEYYIKRPDTIVYSTREGQTTKNTYQASEHIKGDSQ